MSDRTPYELTVRGIVSSVPQDSLSQEDKACVSEYLKTCERYDVRKQDRLLKKIQQLEKTKPIQDCLKKRVSELAQKRAKIVSTRNAFAHFNNNVVEMLDYEISEISSNIIQQPEQYEEHRKKGKPAGALFVFLLYAVRLLVAVLPFIMIGGNFLLTLLLVTINAFVPFASIVFWIWGLVCAIQGVQDFWAILYYISFGLIWIPFYMSTIISFFSKKK